MGEKLTAWIVTAAFIAPVCAACILGPAVIASMFAGIAAWFGGLGTVTTAGLALAMGIAVYEITRQRRARRSPMSRRGELGNERQETP